MTQTAPSGFPTEAWEFALEAFEYGVPQFYRATTPSQVGEPITAADIKQAKWVEYDDGYGEPSLSYLAELHDGRWVYHHAWHDYTGWGCRDASDFYIGTYDEAVSSIPKYEREEAGL